MGKIYINVTYFLKIVIIIGKNMKKSNTYLKFEKMKSITDYPSTIINFPVEGSL